MKKLPIFYENRRLITALTRVRHQSPSWATSFQSISSLLLNINFNVILPLRLGFRSGLSGFRTQTLYTHLLSPLCAMVKWLFCYNDFRVVLILIKILFRAKFESVKFRPWTLICDAFPLEKYVLVICHISVRLSACNNSRTLIRIFVKMSRWEHLLTFV